MSFPRNGAVKSSMGWRNCCWRGRPNPGAISPTALGCETPGGTGIESATLYVRRYGSIILGAASSVGKLDPVRYPGGICFSHSGSVLWMSLIANGGRWLEDP